MSSRFRLVILAAGLTVLLPAPLFAGFGAPFTAYTMTDTLTGVAMADWNGDGHLDVAVSSLSGSAIVWRAGNGGGLLAPPTTIGAVLGASEIAVGDMQGDGAPDWILARGDVNSVSIVLNAAGNPANTYTTGAVPLALAVADLNHDGFLDVVTTNFGANTVSVFVGNGNGTLKPRVDYATGVGPHAITIGDVTGDGHLDVVTANSSANTVTLWRGTGIGTLTTRSDIAVGGTAPSDLVLAHLNGDTNLDIATANQTSGNLSILLGTGGGSFAAPSLVASVLGANGIVAANFDADADIDLAVCGDVGGRVHLNNGLGSFPVDFKFKSGDSPRDLVAGDLNGDGVMDLAVASSLRDVCVLLGNGNGTFGQDLSYEAGVSPRGIAVRDISGDGKEDAVVSDEADGGVRLLLGDGLGGFGASNFYPTGGATLAVALGDFDGDGRLDVATANFGLSPDNVSILFGDGAGGFGPPTTYTAGDYPDAIVARDLNHDGRLDLIVVNYGSAAFTVLRNLGSGTFTSEGTYGVGASPTGIAVGDLNNDTHPDVVVANNDDGNVSVYFGNGSAGFTFVNTFAVAPGPFAVAMGDFDANGYADLAVTSSLQPTVSVLLNTVDADFQPPVEYVAGPAWSIVLVDANLDRRTDLAVGEVSHSTVAILTGAGDGTFLPPSPIVGFPPSPVVGVGAFPLGLAIGQLDPGGQVDIVATNHDDGSIQALLNQGSLPPSPVAPSVLAPPGVNAEAGGTLSFAVSALDLDGDAISTLSAIGLPSGATFIPAVGNTSGTLQWTPTPAQAGDYTVTFTASNALSGSKQTRIHVKPPGTDVTATLLWVPKASDVGTHVLRFHAVNEFGEQDSAATTVTVTSGMGTAFPAGRPAQAPDSPTKGPIISVAGDATVPVGGTLELTVSATDTDSLSTSTTDLSADNTATFSTNGSPILAAPSQVNASPGVPLTVNVTVTDPDNDPIASLTADRSGLPPGNNSNFTMNGSNTSGALTWTPTISDAGTYGVSFAATNALVGTAGTIIHVGAALVGYWKLNGNGLDATQHTNVTPISGEAYAAGRLGQALQLNGSISIGLSAAATADHDFSQPVTVECWVNPGTLTSIKQTFLEAELPSTPTYWALSVQGSTGRAQFEAHGTSSNAQITSTLPITGGLFHHVAVTYDGSLIRLYLDGALNGSVAMAGLVPVNGGTLNVGSGGTTFPITLQGGLLDEVRIWKEVRSEAQIQASMNQELNGYATGAEITGPVFQDALRQNNPNPFNPTTEIAFELAQARRMTIRIFDVAGRLVCTLVDGTLPAGPHRVRWAGKDDHDRRVRSGVYFYRIESTGFRASRQMVLVQ